MQSDTMIDNAETAPDSPAQNDTYVSGMHGSCREDDGKPETLQEELNQIIEAFYAVVGEDGLRKYQEDAESMYNRQIAEGAINAPHTAPDFDLVDQDGDKMSLSTLLQKGPVVIQFYRGSWCPLCNAQIRRMTKEGLPLFEAKGATFIGISPMLPDGTQYLSTKQDLNFSICSDVGNEVARRFKITYRIESEWLREVDKAMMEWNGDDSFEVPLPATYVIAQNGEIVWSLVENDIGICAEMEEVAAAIPSKEANSREGSLHPASSAGPKGGRKNHVSTFKKIGDIKAKFGKKKVSGKNFLDGYRLASRNK